MTSFISGVILPRKTYVSSLQLTKNMCREELDPCSPYWADTASVIIEAGYVVNQIQNHVTVLISNMVRCISATVGARSGKLPVRRPERLNMEAWEVFQYSWSPTCSRSSVTDRSIKLTNLSAIHSLHTGGEGFKLSIGCFSGCRQTFGVLVEARRLEGLNIQDARAAHHRHFVRFKH